MKKILFFAVLTALITTLAACGPKKVTKQFAKTNFATVTIEGSGKYGAINCLTGEELIPQEYANIGYYYSGYFTAQNASGISLFDTLKNQILPPQEQITAKDGYFEFSTAKTSKGDGSKGIFFIKTGKIVSGGCDALEVDKAGNAVMIATVVGQKVFGVFSPENEVILPLEYLYLVYDGENYNAAKNKNEKNPIVDKNGKANWALADATVFDKTGKQIKKLTKAQAKKIFEAQ